MLNLSYSQLSKYQLCPKSYEFYYRKKIRPETKSGALVFGSALDEALNFLLVEKDLKKSKQIFLDNFINTEINGKTVEIKTSDKIVYSVSDFNENLLTEENLKELQNLIPYPKLKERRSNVGWDGMSLEEKLHYNQYNYFCLQNKGILMLESYEKNILTKIKNVVEVQKKVELVSSNGKDRIIGFVDAVVELEGVDGLVVMDNKTSSMPYENTSVFTSQQLSLYSFMLEQQGIKVSHGAYAVLLKSPKKISEKKCKKCGHVPEQNSRHKTCNKEDDQGKRCNGEWDEKVEYVIDTQLIVDKINNHFVDVVVDNLDIITNNIKMDIYPRNFQSCENYWGGKCDYFDFCYKKSID